MSFLDKILSKTEAPITSYNDFWNWFLANEKAFFKTVQNGENIHKGFFDKLAPKLDEIHEGIYFLTGMFDDQTAELVVTPDAIIKNIYVIEELISSAPQIERWKFTALKYGTNRKDFSIEYEDEKFSTNNLNFYPTIHKNYPDEIDLTIVYDNYNEENKSLITNAVYIFLDNYLGELHTVTLIDNINVVGKDEVSEELIPMEKLKDYLIWREKEFVEKYYGIRHNTENDSYSSYEATTKDGGIVIAIMNTGLLSWDEKASHPWMFIITVLFDGNNNNNGMPDNNTYQLLNGIEDEIVVELKELEGYLNVGRETLANKREIFFACKDFRKPSKVADALIKKYNGVFDISYQIYKDKYWQTFRHYEQN